jgi:predicted HTH transcriptional regulator
MDTANGGLIKRIPESLELEYKGRLELGTKDQRREALKDVSAMANTGGGRLLYGVSEVARPDGAKVAGPINPMTDGALVRKA